MFSAGKRKNQGTETHALGPQPQQSVLIISTCFFDNSKDYYY